MKERRMTSDTVSTAGRICKAKKGEEAECSHRERNGRQLGGK